MNRPEKQLTLGALADEVGAALHTALRKVCDSTPTSLAWNLIYLCDHAWSAYLRFVADRLVKGEKPFEAAKAAAVDLHDVYNRVDHPWLAEPHGGNEQFALSCSLKLFSEVDWRCFVSYLADSEGINECIAALKTAPEQKTA